MSRGLVLRPTMSDNSTSSSTSLPEDGYRVQLNNWLQGRGLEDRLTWTKFKEGPENAPIWHAVCRCPFHFSPRLLDSYL